MYAYIDLKRAQDEGKVEAQNLKNYYSFHLAGGRKIDAIDSEGRVHVSFRYALPEEVRPYAFSYSERVTWEVQAHRFTGVYQHGEARGTLEYKRQIERTWNLENEKMDVHFEYILEVEAKNAEDCKELVRLVRAGLIMPAENWESDQTETAKAVTLPTTFWQKLCWLFRPSR